MKVLSTEQQMELQEFIQGLYDNQTVNWSSEEKAFLGYWRLELKAKRVRRNPKEST